uniref:Ral transcription factor IIA subunit 1 like n=1 Tax=Leptobrachium leishanense TaxID=445787 RepID=A0A8C5MHW1_9ANUR
MAHSANANPVPKLYKSIIEDVIDGVSELFAEEGVDEQVLKELKQLWETKVIQSKATEGFFRDCSAAPQFVLQLPQNLHQTRHTTTGVRNLQNFGTNEMNSSVTNGAFTLPHGLTYPIHLPAGMTVQTASGQLYKVTVPVMVTQAPGATRILQQPVQHYFQHINHSTGPPPNSQYGNAQAAHNWQQQVPQVQRPPQTGTLYETETRAEKSFDSGDQASFPQPLANVQQHLPSNMFQQPSSGLAENNFGVVPPPLYSTGQAELPMGNNPGSVLGSLNLPQTIQAQPENECSEVLNSQALDNDAQLDAILEGDLNPNDLLDSNDLNLSEQVSLLEKQVVPVDYDIIQVDGAGDTSSEDDLGNVQDIQDIDENDFLGIIDTEDLKALEEGDTGSFDSTSSINDEDPEIDVIEEDPLNSGDDVSEQEVPDLFDTDNVIVCQYDKIHRSKNKWKFYLKDGVMSFGGKDYIFSKAIGEAEW